MIGSTAIIATTSASNGVLDVYKLEDKSPDMVKPLAEGRGIYDVCSSPFFTAYDHAARISIL
jgi:hypothetical protein